MKEANDTNSVVQARALTGAMLDGVGQVMEKEYGNSEAQKFSSAVSSPTYNCTSFEQVIFWVRHADCNTLLTTALHRQAGLPFRLTVPEAGVLVSFFCDGSLCWIENPGETDSALEDLQRDILWLEVTAKQHPSLCKHGSQADFSAASNCFKC